MPPVIFVALGAIQAAIQAFPQVAAIVEKGKEWISSFTSGGVITIEQQNKLHAHIDAISDSVQAGEIPEGWAVEPD